MALINYLNKIKFAPHCINCKHYLITNMLTGENMYTTAKCTRVIYQSLNKGKNIMEYAYIARKSDKICGPSGKNFEPLVRKKINK